MFLKRRKNKIKMTRSQLALIGSLLLILCGIFIISYKYYTNYNVNLLEEEQVDSYIENMEIIENIEAEETPVIEEQPKVEEKQIVYDYNAVLEIPSINLKRGLVSYDSKYNEVKYNIEIIEKSSMPDIQSGNLILAGHNGNSNISFFKNLYKLNKNDLIYIYYNGYKYVYKYSYYYEVEKTGTVAIVRDQNQTAITLITCKKNSDTKQLVFVGYLIDRIDY